MSRIFRWLDDRSGWSDAWAKFLYERIPSGAGWPHVLGSILLALFGLQLLTGLLLSFLYSASPLSAHPSVRFISEGMPGGGWLRGLHYWGSSAMVIVLGLHLIRTFLFAAYRRPRELTWMLGVFLMLLVLAFGQTGYLLPWDQRAYWGTEVTVRIIQTVPWIGPKIAFLLKGGEAVGALTLSRFYSIHVIVLPLVAIFLVFGHVLLVRKYGVTAPWTRTGEEREGEISFYPYQMAKDSFAILVVLLLVFYLARMLPVPLGNPADPSDTTYVPRPDWYFLFLFQLLRYFEGKWEVIGTFILPSLGISILLFLPFLDRNPERHIRNRPLALLGLILGIGAWSYLTWAAVRETPKPVPGQRPQGILVARADRIKRPSEVGGLHLLKLYCFECHSMTVSGDRPDLQTLATHHFPSGKDWLEEHLKSNGRNQTLRPRESEELMSVLRVLTARDPASLSAIPSRVRFGAHFFYSKACIGCHRIDGQGGKYREVPAPDLTIRPLKPKEWHIQHIHDPRSLVPDSQMPPFFHYEDYEYDALAEYILYLHTP